MTDGMQPPADKQTPNREEGSGGRYWADANASQAEVWTGVAKLSTRIHGNPRASCTSEKFALPRRRPTRREIYSPESGGGGGTVSRSCHMSHLARWWASGRRARESPPSGSCGGRMKKKKQCVIDLPPAIRVATLAVKRCTIRDSRHRFSAGTNVGTT